MLSDVGLGLGAARAWLTIARAPRIAPPRAVVTGRPYTSRRWPGRPPLYDAYLPATPTDAPPRAVVIVHGGAFVIGSRRMLPVLALVDDLVRRGHAVIACDYPLAHGRATLRDQVEAVTEALFIPERHGAELGIEPEGVAALGFSAGATLALLAATSERPRGLARVVSAFGLYDFESLAGPFSRAFRRWVVGPRSRARDASVIATGGPDVPVFLLHGEADSLVDCDQARRLHARRVELGLPVSLSTYPGAEHAFFSAGGEPARRGKADLFSALESGL